MVSRWIGWINESSLQKDVSGARMQHGRGGGPHYGEPGREEVASLRVPFGKITRKYSILSRELVLAVPLIVQLRL